MRILSNGLVDWKRSWKGDLKASLTVAFIAIPLGLGIGLASGVPPLAAVIPSVIGGLLIGWISGGHVIVHSTPKMLIGITAAAVIELGGNDLYLGYRLFLAAVVIAGAIQFLLGLLRMGVLGDLIPASVIKSLLASVGIYIILKQLPGMMGAPDLSHSIVDLLIRLPELFAELNPVVGLIGLLSVIIMFGHARIETPVIKAIPAVLWVILISIAYTYSLGFDTRGSFNLFGRNLEFGPEFLIQLPADMTKAIVSPNFGIWQTTTFWTIVLSVVVVSSIEAILSVKAIDRLDLKKRKSNVNRELGAIGLGTMISGFFGGLPVIPGIVPSSVSANNDGKTQLVDFFQALLILLLAVVLGSQLQHIPLAALAGILIHTGYKLVNPKEIANIIRIGWDETLIFSITLFATLGSNLILGIAIGMLTTLVIHIVRLGSVSKLFTILFRPNVVSYQDDDGDVFVVSVKGYSSFLNFPRLKKALDLIPSDASINLDLSLAEFIDHSVMEHLADYEENHIRRGGKFEILGLDTHLSAANHSLASRFKKSVFKGSSIDRALTSRQLKLADLAKEFQWTFDSDIHRFDTSLEHFHFFRNRTVDRTYNRISGTVSNCSIIILDVDHHQGELESKYSRQNTMAIIELDRRIPSFIIEKEYLFDKIAALAGYNDIDFPAFKRFSDEFRLTSEDEAAARSFFSPQIISFLEENLRYSMECDGEFILLKGKDRLMNESEVRELMNFSNRFVRLP